jgi:hypothetical protein
MMDTQQDSIKEGGHGRKGKIKNAKNHRKSNVFFLKKKKLPIETIMSFLPLQWDRNISQYSNAPEIKSSSNGRSFIS